MTKSRGIQASKGTRPRWVAENQGRFICGCGCGRPVTLRPEHYPNAPRFLHGHNMTGVIRRPKPPPVACGCGCGQMAKAGNRFVNGHNARDQEMSPETRQKLRDGKVGARNPMFGKHPPNFKGRIYHTNGYVLQWAPEHPFASNGRVMEHRLLLEQYLRITQPHSPHLVLLGEQLYLEPDIEVHHIDGVKDNNAIANLLPLTKVEHARLHAELKRSR